MVNTSPYIDLPDGRRFAYAVRTSARSRSLRLKVTARDGLIVIAPQGLGSDRIAQLVASKGNWILGRLRQFDEIRHLLNSNEPAPPQAFDLPAFAESWIVEYRETCSKTVGARTDRPGKIVVSGTVSNPKRCNAALRRWLARRAKEALTPWLETLSIQTGLKCSSITIKSQRTRWGSCSVGKVISLNSKLLFLTKEMARYVLIHELCHTMEHNHSIRFWALVRQFEPKTDTLHGSMPEAWKQIPVWAHPIRMGKEVV
jgi:predicted metal-dependent hydrolase